MKTSALEPRIDGLGKTGTLRIGLFPSFFYGRNAASELAGWGIEIARELALHLGVGVEFSERASPPAVVAALRAGECDAAFLGISAARAAEVDFTPPWMQADFTFLVTRDSPVARIADADRVGLRIGLVRHHTMDTALTGQFVQATRVYADTPDAAFELFKNGDVEVLAGIRPGLNAYAANAPGSRVLADKYGANVIGLAVAKGRLEWLSLVSAFVVDSKASGAARTAVERSGAHGLEIVA